MHGSLFGHTAHKSGRRLLTQIDHAGGDRIYGNLGSQRQRLTLPDWAGECRVLLSTLADAAMTEDASLLLGADEGVILTLD